MTLSVCIFAHNEERLLPECIGALDRAAPDVPYTVHILVNGCTDHTGEVAISLAAADSRLTVHTLPVADKANAWNDYVYRLAPQSDAHIFIDGDVKPSENAIRALAETLAEHPHAYAAAALPATGRSRRQWTTQLYLDRHLSGNLYALSGKALQAFRNRNLHLPFGAKGEDGLIAYLLLTDLQGGENDSHDERITVSDGATFEFQSLRLNALDLQVYHRRLLRYSERHFQKQTLYPLLKKAGVQALPESIYEIYTPEAFAAFKPRAHPLYYFYDRVTLKRLRQLAK